MSRDTILTFSYHITNDTWPDEHYRIVVSASPDAHCVIALWHHMERFNVTRSRTLWRHFTWCYHVTFSPDRPPTIIYIHVKKCTCKCDMMKVPLNCSCAAKMYLEHCYPLHGLVMAVHSTGHPDLQTSTHKYWLMGKGKIEGLWHWLKVKTRLHWSFMFWLLQPV